MRQYVAQLNEVWSRNGKWLVIFWWLTLEWWREVGNVRDRSIAGDAVIILYTTFSGQSVVVPTHWVENGLAAHAPKPGDGVGVCV